MKKFFKENWKYFLIVSVFAILCVLLTYVMIKKIGGGEIVLRENINESPEGIDLFGTYDMNDLHTDTSTYVYKDVEVSLLQVSGLKNKKVEKDINDEIKTLVDTWIDEGYDFVSMYVCSNFSNMLSINVYCNKSTDDYDDYENMDTRNTYLNYNLNDGSKISFKDLFVNDANINLIVRNAMYEAKVENNFWNELYKIDTLDNVNYERAHEDLHKKPIPVDDEELTNEVLKFINTPDEEKSFAIYPTGIFLFYTKDKYADPDFLNAGNQIGRIDFLKNAKDLAVYDRYVCGKKLFEEKFAPKDVITCVDYTQDYLLEELRGEISSNLYVDFSRSWYLDEGRDWDHMLGEEKIEKYNKKYEWYVEEVKNKIIKDLKKEASKDKNCYHLAFISLEACNVRVYQQEMEDIYSFYVPSDAICFRLNVNTYKIPMSEWKDTYHDRLFETYRVSYFNYSQDKRLLFKDIDEYDEGNPHGIVFNHEYTSRIFNFMTDEEIKTVDDMFIEGTITEETLEYELWDQYANNYWEEVPQEELDNLLSEGITYQLDSDSIHITSNAYPERSTYLYFGEIDVPLFKIFDEDVVNKVSEVLDSTYGEGYSNFDDSEEILPEWNEESENNEESFEAVSDPKLSDTIDKSTFEVESNGIVEEQN